MEYSLDAFWDLRLSRRVCVWKEVACFRCVSLDVVLCVFVSVAIGLGNVEDARALSSRSRVPRSPGNRT